MIDNKLSIKPDISHNISSYVKNLSNSIKHEEQHGQPMRTESNN